jgi:hypothetical protein
MNGFIGAFLLSTSGLLALMDASCHVDLVLHALISEVHENDYFSPLVDFFTAIQTLFVFLVDSDSDQTLSCTFHSSSPPF